WTCQPLRRGTEAAATKERVDSPANNCLGECHNMPRRHDWIEFTLQIGCQLACDYCPQTVLATRFKQDGGPVKRMTMDTFMTILDHCPLDEIGVDFSGYSDPCLHPQFIEF